MSRQNHLSKELFFQKIGYAPFPEQQEFHDSDARYRILAAGTRFGKSMSAGYEAAYEALVPNTQIWIVGPSYLLAEKEFRYAWDALIVKLGLGQHCKRKNNNVELGDMYIELPNGSWIRAKSTAKPADLLGEELDLIVLAEGSQIKSIVWDRYLRGRLVSRRGKMICNCTPNEKDKLVWPMFQRGQDPTEPNFWSAQHPSWTNPYIDKEEIEDARKYMSKDMFDEQYGGQFVTLGAHSIFPARLLHAYLKEALARTPARGFVHAHLAGAEMNPVLRHHWEENDEGPVKIYNEFDPMLHYVVSGDVADDETPDGDFSALDVLCVDTGRQALHYRGSMDPGELAHLAGALGYMYGTAPIGIERNNMGHATNHELKRFYRGPIYRTPVLDKSGRKETGKDRIGWVTSHKTKPVMMKELKKALEDGRYIPQDPDTISELLDFGRDRKHGKLMGLNGSNDDRVIAAAISVMVARRFPESISADPDLTKMLDMYGQVG